MSSRLSIWLIAVATTFAVWVNLPSIPKLPSAINFYGRQVKVYDLFPVKFGLDLQGGTQLILRAEMDKVNASDRDSALESARQVIERRVNLYGVSESLVQTSRVGNERRIIVELPGIKDTKTAVDLVGKTALLEFKEYDASGAAILKEQLGTASAEASNSALIDSLSFVSTGLTGKDLKKAAVVFGQSQSGSGGPEVSIEFTSEGAEKFATITKRNVGKPLGMFLDDTPVTWPPPTVNGEILGGSAVISGRFSAAEAKNLAIQLNAGALPVPIKILEQRLIGASLGDVMIQKSIVAGAIGIATIMIFMILIYGWYGLVADAALVIYTLLTLAIFRTGLFVLPPITLTLAGIAGLILSIGMAVDANILTFDRIKEEIRLGKDKRMALAHGFSRAWPSIRDSNISSLITASILYAFGTSVVRGFAVTLFLGVMVSMFSAITVTRTLLKLVTNIKTK